MSNLPLSGIRVIDLGHAWAGPHASRLLSDFGAEVIKVEYPHRLDLMRGAKKEGKAYDHQPGFLHVNRNKKSLTLNLRNQQDYKIFQDLVRISDVVIDNFTPGVLTRLGISYETLKSLNSKIIMVSMSAFGQTGPEASYRGYGATMEAVSGIQSLSAYQAGETPRRIREMDVTNGIMGACATLTALLKCQQTGEGEWIDLSQMEAATHALIGEHFLEYATNGSYSPPRGNRHATHAPQGCYRCQGEDKWIAISIRSEQEWQSLCTVIGQPQLVDNPQFFTCVERMNNHSQLDQLIEEWSIQHTHIEAMHLLQKAGIAAGAVLNVAEIAQDPHLKKRGYFQTLNSNGEINFPGFPFRLAKGSGVIDTAGPELGEHNRYVICELLGQPEEQVKPLMEDEVRTFFAVDTE